MPHRSSTSSVFASGSRDPYSLDYTLHDAGAEVERVYGIFSSLRAAYTYGTRSVPDSTAIAYRRHLVVAEWNHEIGPHSLGLEQRLERRLYHDPSARSHFLDYDATLSLGLALQPRLRLRPSYRADLISYDTPDHSLFSDSSDQTLEVLLEGDASEWTTLALGPRAEFRRTESDLDRAYNQWGLKGTVSFLSGPSLWIQFTDEVGVREHLAGDVTISTDYVYNWSTLYVSWQLLQRLGFDLYFSISPESHKDNANDTTTILLSTALTYGWR